MVQTTRKTAASNSDAADNSAPRKKARTTAEPAAAPTDFDDEKRSVASEESAISEAETGTSEMESVQAVPEPWVRPVDFPREFATDAAAGRVIIA
jgi:hypothetical protein